MLYWHGGGASPLCDAITWTRESRRWGGWGMATLQHRGAISKLCVRCGRSAISDLCCCRGRNSAATNAAAFFQIKTIHVE